MLSSKSKKRVLHCIGAAWGLGCDNPAAGEGPLYLQSHKILASLPDVEAHWAAMLTPSAVSEKSAVESIEELCKNLAQIVASLREKKESFVTLGGDHSCAIGTWNGVLNSLNQEQPFGLLWVDAHMDSHTPHTTETQRIHGMPLACLLGYGDERLLKLNRLKRVLDPSRVCVLGVRSYEAGEAKLLEDLKVRVFNMDEIHQRGLKAVFQDALAIVRPDKYPYGISIDLDAFEPTQTPGVNTPERDGVDLALFCQLLNDIRMDPYRVGAEIVEYTPANDKEHATEKAIIKLLESLF